MERITSEDEITIKDGAWTVAHFDVGDGIDGEICEGHESPLGKPIRMQPSDLIALSTWLLQKAEERANDLETA